MADAVDRFLEAASAIGVEVAPTRFPEGTRTAEQAARATGCEVGQIVKSLVFLADGEAFLALTSGANRADPALMAAALGASAVRRADAEEARAATGFAIGGVPPFGHARALRVLVDRDLLAYEVVWAAAGRPDTSFPISPQELLRASRGLLVDLKEA